MKCGPSSNTSYAKLEFCAQQDDRYYDRFRGLSGSSLASPKACPMIMAAVPSHRPLTTRPLSLRCPPQLRCQGMGAGGMADDAILPL